MLLPSMLTSLEIEGYRGFDHFKLPELGRINLLVGGNNSGKTSILEAVEILMSGNDPFIFWNIANRRGELLQNDDSPNAIDADICHLFHGHQIEKGGGFKINGKNDQELSINISPDISGDLYSSNQLIATRLPVAEEPFFILSNKGGIVTRELFRREMYRKKSKPKDRTMPLFVVPTSSLNVDDMVELLGNVMLNPDEDLLIEALRFIEPDIERLVPIPVVRSKDSQRGGVRVKLSGFKYGVPISSMGEGMWRMLSLALSLIQAKDGVLLVDEIDSGLHYSVMEDMWRLILKTAERFNIQVFATTHSSDCWKALASVIEQDNIKPEEASLHRIERGRKESVLYDGKMLAIASESNYEIR